MPATYRKFRDAHGGDTAAAFLILLLPFIAWYGGCARSAGAHGIAGNRLFVGTLSFDDPAVADEFSTTLSRLKQLVPGGTATDTEINAALLRLLTPDLAFQADATWINRPALANPNATGFYTNASRLKGLLLTMISMKRCSRRARLGPAWRSRRLGAHATFRPGIFFAKGLWRSARQPFRALRSAISGAVSIEHPTVSGRTRTCCTGVHPCNSAPII
jgi:hypothetical protein